ncbi:MAG: lysylphosphatidylglycerol synthase transmembrane domain-containing protein [Deltaproteobacteria bacterium]|nr:lysylphosphatidylglycerol synthase transmembrane domain-containing protein [Deltaproteobacteria bacterium]
MKKIIFLTLKIFISVALLVFLFRKADMGNVWTIMQSINFPMFAAVALLYAISQIISTYRWSLFLPHAGIDMPFLKLVSLYYVGMFFNIFLPTAIGGDVVKSYYLYKFSGKGGNSLASVFLDRFTGFFALVTIAFVSLIFGYNYVKDTYVPLLVAALTALFFLSSLILWNKGLHNWALVIIRKVKLFGINEKIESLYNAVMLYKDEPLILLKAFGVSFVIQFISISIFYLISKGFGMTVSMGYFFLFVPIAVSISMIPISLSGLGLREGAFVYLFTKVGTTDAQALSISLAGFAVMVMLGLIGGIEYMRLGSVKNESQDSKVS